MEISSGCGSRAQSICRVPRPQEKDVAESPLWALTCRCFCRIMLPCGRCQGGSFEVNAFCVRGSRAFRFTAGRPTDGSVFPGIGVGCTGLGPGCDCADT